MKVLKIVWQRYMKDGKTCNRCHATQGEVRGAVSKMRVALRPLGIKPALQLKKVSEKAFQSKSSESNRIWIGGIHGLRIFNLVVRLGKVIADNVVVTEPRSTEGVNGERC